MKLQVIGCNPGEFTVRIPGTDLSREFSRAHTPYETAHEIANWLEEVTAPPQDDIIAKAQAAMAQAEEALPETQPGEPEEETKQAVEDAPGIVVHRRKGKAAS